MCFYVILNVFDYKILIVNCENKYIFSTINATEDSSLFFTKEKKEMLKLMGHNKTLKYFSSTFV